MGCVPVLDYKGHSAEFIEQQVAACGCQAKDG